MRNTFWKTWSDSRKKFEPLRTANSFHVKGGDRSVQCFVFMITGGRIPSIREMKMDEYEWRSMEDIDPVDLRMSSKMWEKRGLVSMGKTIEHTP